MKQIKFILFILMNLWCLTSQQNCWTVYENRQLFGGTPQNSVPSLNSCQTLCQSTSGCKAIEWIAAAPGEKCFLFYSSDQPSYLNNGINHYISLCSCNWVSYPGKRNFGGVIQSQATDLDKCKMTCYYSSNCLAIEFISDQNQCFTFSDGALPTNDAAGITHYIFKCSDNQLTSNQPTPTGACTWNVLSNTGTVGGKLISDVTTMENCKYVCVQMDGCKMGFDWNSNLKLCWKSTTTETFNAPDVSHYAYNCNNQAILSWNVVQNRNRKNGILQPTAQTVDECKAACQDSGCAFGFDWDNNVPMGQQCWLSTQIGDNYASGVDHYNANRGLMTSPGYSSECTWTAIENSNSPLGMSRSDLTTLASCQKNCLDIRCPGIDWDAKGFIKCWISRTNNIIYNDYPGVTHYSYTCPGDLTTTTIPSLSTKLGRDCDYVLYPDSGSTGGVEKTYSSDTECRNQCTVQQNCKAYEWRSGAGVNNCVFYSTDNLPVNSGNRPGYSYYIFRKCY